MILPAEPHVLDEDQHDRIVKPQTSLIFLPHPVSILPSNQLGLKPTVALSPVATNLPLALKHPNLRPTSINCPFTIIFLTITTIMIVGSGLFSCV